MTTKHDEQPSESTETTESTSSPSPPQDWMELLVQEEFWTASALPDEEDDQDEDDMEIGVERPIFERPRQDYFQQDAIAEEADAEEAEDTGEDSFEAPAEEEKAALPAKSEAAEDETQQTSDERDAENKAQEKEEEQEESDANSSEEKAPEAPAQKAAPASAPEVVPALAPPGGIGATTPFWVSAFQGTSGYVLLFLIAFVVFSLFAGKRFSHQSNNPHYVMLADALLHGRWHLKSAPVHPVTGKPMGNDWAYLTVLRLRSINGKSLKKMRIVRGRYYRPYYRKKVRIAGEILTRKDVVFVTTRKRILRLKRRDIIHRSRVYYVSFPPLPAFAMMGPMYVFKKLKLPYLRYKDTVFTLFFAALAVMLMFWLLQKMSFRGYSDRTMYENLLLTLLFAFGTVFFFVSVQGTVWFTALVMGTVCLIPAVGWTLDDRHPFLVGLFIGLAFLARPLLILTALLFFYINSHDEEGRFVNPLKGERLNRMIKFCTPLTGIVLAMMAVNYMRFQNPMEFGHLYLPAVYNKAMEFGLFHPAWFYRNFFSHFFMPPLLNCKAPYVRFTTHGLSMFLVTPVFLLLFFSFKRTKRFIGLLGMMLVIMLPTLFYQNTGWETFGNRFSVDYNVFLILMLAMGKVRFGGLFKFFLLWSVAVNAFGAATFNRFMQFYERGYNSINWIYAPSTWIKKLIALLKCLF
jgi:hypothetical protein